MQDAIEAGERTRSWRLAALVCVIVWGLMTHGTFAGSGDEPHYLMIAHSLAFDGDLDLANDYRDASLIGGGTLDPGLHVRERGGRLLPVHDIGLPLLFAPIVRIAYPLAGALGRHLPERFLSSARLNSALILRHEISFVMAALTALLARELFFLLLSLGGDGPRAFRWALLFAASPPILSHAFLFFTEILAALIALFVFRRITRGVRTAGAAAMLGAMTGFLLLVHSRDVGIVGGLSLVILVAAIQERISWRTLAIFAVAAALGVGARMAVTETLWGTLIATPLVGLQAAGAAEIVREIVARSTGMLFDREYGLLAYAPIYLIAAPGLFFLFRAARPLAIDVTIVAGGYLIPVLLPVTNPYGFTGGWSPAARFLVPIVPLLWAGVFAASAHVRGAGRWIVRILVALQVAIDVYVWQFPKTLWNDGNGVSAFRWSGWLPTSTSADAALPFALAVIVAAAMTYVCLKTAATRPLSTRST